MPDRGAIILDPGYTEWVCPNNCSIAPQRTRPLPPNAARFHQCGKLHGLTVPLVRAGSDCHAEAVLRPSYVGKELVQTAPEDGRPYMALITRYADGRNDAMVYAPTAAASIGG
jgi:hypothetical protein